MLGVTGVAVIYSGTVRQSIQQTVSLLTRCMYSRLLMLLTCSYVCIQHRRLSVPIRVGLDVVVFSLHLYWRRFCWSAGDRTRPSCTVSRCCSCVTDGGDRERILSVSKIQ